jgi:hypothetical protein
VTGSGANPANAADFGGTLPSGTVSFAAGETSKTITVNVSRRHAGRTGRRLHGHAVGRQRRGDDHYGDGQRTIRNDDSALSIAALNANKFEGNSGTTPFTFTVTRSGYYR